jgi:hypothetical protein
MEMLLGQLKSSQYFKKKLFKSFIQNVHLRTKVMGAIAWSFYLVLLLGIRFASTQLCGFDDYEPNDSFQQAKPGFH